MERRDERFSWTWDGVSVELGLTEMGSGPTVLLLPALSSISTRAEMLPLQRLLGTSFRTISVDWPGFGDLPRPKADWRPETYRAFLQHLAEERVRPQATVAAGHAASYALAQGADKTGSLGPISLISPTWRGPLPTMFGRRLALFGLMARGVDIPFAGAAFYRLNVNRPVIGLMMRGHVYENPALVTPEFMAAKLRVTEAPGARYASFRFVTGELDLFHDREAMLAAARAAGVPLQVVRGAKVPRKSGAEMAALAALPEVETADMTVGKLSVYEEHADAVAPAVADFLRRSL